jgi:hypothetical protein
MIVIDHQDIAVKAKLKLFYGAAKQLQKLLPVLIVSKDRFALVTPRRNVIVRAGVFNS